MVAILESGSMHVYSNSITLKESELDEKSRGQRPLRPKNYFRLPITVVKMASGSWFSLDDPGDPWATRNRQESWPSATHAWHGYKAKSKRQIFTVRKFQAFQSFPNVDQTSGDRSETKITIIHHFGKEYPVFSVIFHWNAPFRRKLVSIRTSNTCTVFQSSPPKPVGHRGWSLSPTWILHNFRTWWFKYKTTVWLTIMELWLCSSSTKPNGRIQTMSMKQIFDVRYLVLRCRATGYSTGLCCNLVKSI